MRDLGNTLIVVEHDEDTMPAADYSSTLDRARACTEGESSARIASAKSWRDPKSHDGTVPVRPQVQIGFRRSGVWAP